MNRVPDLLQAHAETLFILDESGDMVSVNVPWGDTQPDAPAFHLGWSDDSYLALFRHGVDQDTRAAVQLLLQSQWPFAVSRNGPPDRAQYVSILGGTSRHGSGPAFITDTVPELETDTVALSVDNAHLLRGVFEEGISEIGDSLPASAVVVDDQAVSICRTVRRSRHGIEAGVHTLVGYRRRGYARRAVAAWYQAARREGILGFYSTGYDNEASCSLANSLGLKQIGAEYSAE